MRLEVRRKLWLGDVRRVGLMIKEAAHKRNQIGLLLPPTCHVWAAIYLERKGSHDPQSWNNTNPTLKLLNLSSDLLPDT